jgi:hypothetical protein
LQGGTERPVISHPGHAEPAGGRKRENTGYYTEKAGLPRGILFDEEE